jgi:glutamate-ammonia-ligase adenylyltransferase
MTDDRRTQILPEENDRRAALATFLGDPDETAFASRTLAVLRRVERRYAGLFEEEADLSAGVGNLVFTGAADDPDTLRTLAGMGYADPSAVAAQVRAWHHGRYRAMRSPRARELMTELMPSLLQALAATASPDQAFRHFDRFLAQLPAGVQLLSMFHVNPELLGLVAEIMGGAPRLAEQLSARPQLFDAVLSAAFAAAIPGRAALDAELAAVLRHARDYEDVLDAARRWKAEREFQVGVQLLRGAVDVPGAGAALSDVADAALAALLPAVEAEFAKLHGRLPGAELGIVALGKLGGRELTFTSDVDLLLLYDLPESEVQSDGPRPLSVGHFYNRLAPRLINAISALTAEGRLYEVDTRLRPSGFKGPIAVGLDGFRRYNAEDAWAWEHMALTRARVVAASPGLAAKIADAVRGALTRVRDPAQLVADVAAMRALMVRERRVVSPWDMKHRRGGLVDVEFAVQFLQLRHAAERPDLIEPNTGTAIARLAEAGLLARDDADALGAAHALLTTVQGVLRLAVDGPFDPANAPPALLARLARASGALDFAALEATLGAAASRALAVFERLVPPEAASSGRTAPE